MNALDDGRTDGGGELSPSTVHHMHRVLKHSLSQAVKWQLLARNPADAVDPPKVERMALQTYDMLADRRADRAHAIHPDARPDRPCRVVRAS